MDKETLLVVYKAITEEREKYIEHYHKLRKQEDLYDEDNTELLQDTLGYIQGLDEALKVIKRLDKVD